jgi:hypothetical protein
MSTKLHIPRRGGRTRNGGFVLIALLALLSMGVLYFITVQLDALGKYQLEAREGHTGGSNSIEQARQALVAYAITYRDSNPDQVFGYLPCPDTSGSGEAASSCGSADQGAIGLLPYKTLGLADLRDAQGDCLWYAVSGSFKNSPKSSSLLMNWDTQGQFRILDSNGAILVQPDDTHGGAAAVIFSPGAALAGQSRSASANGPCQVDPAAQTAYLDGSYTFTASETITLTQGSTSSVNGGQTNNDRLAWVTPKEVFDRIVLRKDFNNALTATPSGQINALSDMIKTALEKKIQDDLVAGTTGNSQPANTGNFSQPSGKQVGTVTDISASLNAGSDSNYYANWYDQYRQVMCSTLDATCLTAGSAACRGALMFSGRNTSGQPRTTAQRDYSTANLDHYFEASSGREILNSTTTAFSGATAYAENGTAANRAADIGTCLFPGAFTSFARDIASFQSGLVYSGTSAPASVDTGALTVRMGGTANANSSACVWYPSAVPMESMLRLYFRVQFVTKGRGFTLALADAATNPFPAQLMCGSTGASGNYYRLGYGGIPSGGSSAGIHAPKLGIEFDTAFESSASDPARDHLAFLFWGGSGDSGPTGSGNDDNTHFAGLGGARITGYSWAGGTLTLTTATAHGLAGSQAITVSGISPGSANKTYAVQSTPATNQITVSLSSDPGAYVSGGSVRAFSTGAEPRNSRVGTVLKGPVSIADASYDSVNDRITFDTDNVAHGFAIGQKVYVSAIFPKAYGGVYTVLASGYRSDATCVSNSNCRFRVSKATSPGSYSSGGTVVAGSEISAVTATTGPNSASATTTSSHGFSSGTTTTTFGLDPSGFGVTASLSSAAGTSLTYPLGSNLSASVFAAESPAGMVTMNGSVPYFASSDEFVLTTAASPYNGSAWTSTVYHVRLDIARSHDSANGAAVLTMKAYIGDQGGSLPDTCSISDFKDLSRDLSAICPYRTATLQQNSVPVSNLANISAASWDSGPQVVTVTTTAAHGLATGGTIKLSGATPTAYNGTHTINVTGSTSFTYPLVSNPGTWAAGGMIEPLANVFFGFTTARGNTNADDQNVVLSNLLMRSQ